MVINYVLTIILIFITTITNAELPSSISCKSVAVSDEDFIALEDKSNLVLFHNLSKMDVWLIYKLESETNSNNSQEASRLQADHWSALVLNNAAFKLSCIESQPGHEQMIPCVGIISMCRSTLSKAPMQVNGWAAENMIVTHLIEYLGSRGFELESSSPRKDLT